MSTLTPHLDTALLVIASSYPIGFCANVAAVLTGARNFGRNPSISGNLVGLVAGYAVLLTVVGFARPQQVFAFHVPAVVPLFLLAPLVGIACIVLEYLTGILVVFLRTRKLVTRMAVHDSYSSAARIGAKDVLSILALVAGEELVLRQLLYRLLAEDCAMTPWIVIAICTIAYAVNHLHFGPASVISKLVSGLLYVLLFVFSGLSIGVVILAHATQNLTLLRLSRARS
jgi:membrane protease YdiL (CAAX protease family)